MATDKTGKALFDEILSQQQTSAPTEEAQPTSGKALFDAVLKQQSAPQPPTDIAATPTEPAVDEGLVKKIMDTTAAAGQPVSREEAITRARRTTALLRGNRTGTISQDEAPSATGAFVEGAIQGAVPFGIGPLVVPPVEALFSFIPGLEDLSLEAQARRREENEGTFLAGEVAGALTTGGTSLLVKGGSKLAGTAAGRLVRALDVGERLAGRATARAAGTTLGAEINATRAAVAQLQAEKAAGSILTKAEEQLLTQYERLVKPTLYEKAATKVAPRLGRTGAAATKAENLAEENAIRILSERAAAEKLKTSLTSLGVKGVPALEKGTILAKAGANAALIPAVETALYTAGSGVRDFVALTPEQVEASGENLAGVFFSNAVKGAGTGGGLGLALPLVPAGLAKIADVARVVSDELAAVVVPALGSIGTRLGRPGSGASYMQIREAFKAVNELTRKDIYMRERKLINGLQAQYEAAETYAKHLQNVANKYRLVDDAGNALDLGGSGLAEDLAAIRNKYMKQNKDGRWVYKPDAVLEDFYKSELEERVVDATTGATEKVSKLPAELGTLQQSIRNLELNLTHFYDKARSTGLVPAATAPSAAATLLEARRQGSLLMQRDFLPGEIGSATRPLPFDVKPEGIYPRVGVEGRADARDLATLTSLANIRTADVKSGGAGIAEFFVYEELIRRAAEEGAGVAGAGALAAKTLVDALFFPGNVIDTYRKASNIVDFATNRSKSFAKYIATPSGVKKVIPPIGDEVRESVPYLRTDREGQLALTKTRAREIYNEDVAFLDKLSGEGGLDAIQSAYGGDLDDLDAEFPNMGTAAGSTLPRQVQFLNAKRQEIFKTDAPPTDAQMYQYALYSRYVRDPQAIYEDIIRKNYVPDAALQVLQNVYPAFYSQLALDVLEQVSDTQDNNGRIDGKQMTIINKILGRPNTKLDAKGIRALQTSFQQSAPPAGRGGPVSNRRVELEREGTSQGQ